MTTMDEKYGDGSDCQVCERCGMCIDCGDCDNYGCTIPKSEVKMGRDEILTMLHEGVCDITFTKVDGSERKMIGTLKETMLPPRKENTKAISINKETVRLYDLEKEGWRSFRINALKSITASKS